MVRLNWLDPASRRYEYGVDQGVLFVGLNDGVAWNGLISIDEAPAGGDAKPVYLDGYKFANISATEEFEFSIESFSAPKEFIECDGYISINHGFFASHQPRKPFSFSYRTTGSTGLDEEFHKIHIVYDILSEPSDHTYETITSTQTPTSKTWNCKTLPRVNETNAPYSHLIIDSRFVPSYNYDLIQDVLYGTSSQESRLPDFDEIVSLMLSSATKQGYGHGPYGRTSYG